MACTQHAQRVAILGGSSNPVNKKVSEIGWLGITELNCQSVVFHKSCNNGILWLLARV
jgi:hypothetical protein